MLIRVTPRVLLLVAGCGRALSAGGTVPYTDGGAAADFAAPTALAAAAAVDGGVTCGDLGSDPQCGACGRACDVIATGQSMPAALVVDSANVYWRNLGVLVNPEPPDPGPYGHGQIVSSPVGSSALTILGDGLVDVRDQSGPSAFAIDNGVMYFSSALVNQQRRLASCPLAGCASGPTTLFGGQYYTTILVDGATLYWSEYSDSAVASGPIGGGSATTLWTPRHRRGRRRRQLRLGHGRHEPLLDQQLGQNLQLPQERLRRRRDDHRRHGIIRDRHRGRCRQCLLDQ